MSETLDEKHARLLEEYDRGQKKLAELRLHERALHESLLRLSGAIEMLEQCMGDAGAAAEHDDEPKLATVP